jgi:hypothetical protein
VNGNQVPITTEITAEAMDVGHEVGVGVHGAVGYTTMGATPADAVQCHLCVGGALCAGAECVPLSQHECRAGYLCCAAPYPAYVGVLRAHRHYAEATLVLCADVHAMP